MRTLSPDSGRLERKPWRPPASHSSSTHREPGATDLLRDDRVLTLTPLNIVRVGEHRSSLATHLWSVGARTRLLQRVAAVSVLLTVLFLRRSVEVRSVSDFFQMRVTIQNALILSAFALLWPYMLTLVQNWNPPYQRARKDFLRSVVAAGITTGLVLLTWRFTSSQAFSVGWAAILWLGITMVALAPTIVRAVRTPWTNPRKAKRVLIVGTGPRSALLSDRMSRDQDVSYEVVGFVDTPEVGFSTVPTESVLGPVSSLEVILMEQVVDEVVIGLPIRSRYAEIAQAIEICERVGVHSKFPTDIFSTSIARTHVEHGSSVSMLSMHAGADEFRLLIKRLIDVVGAACGIIVLSPLLIGVAIAIKVTSDGPVLFRQERYGHKRNRFKMYKFRTMVQNAEELQSALEDQNEASGPVFKIARDPRITRIGRFLRQTSLDELPQLLNVLSGEMSLVGPRPLPLRDVHRFDAGWLLRRFSVVPGLTCLWQIRGRCELSFDQWMVMDLEYIDRWSLWLDTQIIFRTIPAVLRGTGAG